MKIIFIVLLCISVLVNANAQVNRPTTESAEIKTVAKPVYEMKQYWFVMLTKSANRNHDSVTAAKIQQGHMANIGKLVNSGKLMVAGPFGDDGNWRGIFILDCKDKDEAEKLLQTDPAISSGRLAYKYIHGGRPKMRFLNNVIWYAFNDKIFSRSNRHFGVFGNNKIQEKNYPA